MNAVDYLLLIPVTYSIVSVYKFKQDKSFRKKNVFLRGLYIFGGLLFYFSTFPVLMGIYLVEVSRK